MTETPETTELARPERSLFRRYLWAWIALMLLGVMLIFWHTCLRSAPLRVSKSTTYFTGPIDPATGRLDLDALARELLYRDIPPEENGFLLYHRKGEDGLSPAERFVDLTDYLYEALPDFSAEKREWGCRITGLDEKQFQEMVENKPDEKKGDMSDPFGKLHELMNQDKRLKLVGKIKDYLLSHPWQQEDVVIMQEWLDATAEPLDTLARALRYKEFWGFAKDPENPDCDLREALALLETDVVLRGCEYDLFHFSAECAAFQARSCCRLGQGDLDAAWDDIFSAILNFSDSDAYIIGKKHPTAFPHMQSLVEQNDLTAEQCRRFLADLDRVPEFPQLIHLDLVRLEILGRVEKSVAHLSVLERRWDNIKKEPTILFLDAIDWNIVYREIWRNFDRTVEILQTPGLDAVDRKNLAGDYLAQCLDCPDYEFSRQTLTVRSRSRLLGRILGYDTAYLLTDGSTAERLSELREILTQKLAEAERTAGRAKTS